VLAAALTAGMKEKHHVVIGEESFWARTAS
jgi:hypothetical protein